jgi:hypothetical protein
MLSAMSLMALAIINCSGGTMEPTTKITLPSFKSISAEKWQKLSQKKIYFGHQSIGFNIIDGIKDVMKENPEIKLNIVETADPTKFGVPLFAHSRVGKNTDPRSKIDAFSGIMASGIGNSADLAFLKFCYVDVDARTDINKVFTDYKKTMDQLKKDYPKTAIVHFTLPLTVAKTTIKTKIKSLLGKQDIWEYNDNIKRNEFNEKLRKEYEGKEPLFDLAAIESTYPDGKRSSFRVAGKTYYSLIPGYTTDGGHLNEQGRRIAAQALLTLLAGLDKP